MNNAGSNVAMMASAGAVAGAQQQQIIANGIKASGAIVRVDPAEFQRIIDQSPDTLVVVAEGMSWFRTCYSYLTNYRGLFFYAVSSEPLLLPNETEVLPVKKIWVPG